MSQSHATAVCKPLQSLRSADFGTLGTPSRPNPLPLPVTPSTHTPDPLLTPHSLTLCIGASGSEHVASPTEGVSGYTCKQLGFTQTQSADTKVGVVINVSSSYTT